MDAFYASIEQRDNPEFRGKPVAVGYSGRRGVVAAASYEARKYGVRSAMPSRTAIAKCPELIFAPPRFDVYRKVSNEIREIFLDYTDLVEPLSLDEAFLDITVNYKNIPSATLIVREIKLRIREQTGLTASAGVSVNKFLAKIASDFRKPDGLFVIKPEAAADFVANLEIERFFGIGKVTAEKMHRMGIHTGADLRTFDEQTLVASFGKAGHSYYRYARGIDNREVQPDRIRKSVGAESTFLEDIGTVEELAKELVTIREYESKIRRFPANNTIKNLPRESRRFRYADPNFRGAFTADRPFRKKSETPRIDDQQRRKCRTRKSLRCGTRFSCD